MSSTSRIEWTDATWNPITGCTPCSPGCDHCYARTMIGRHLPSMRHDGPFSRVQFHASRLNQPLHWRRARRIFVCSMGDLFHQDVHGAWLDAVFFRMVLCPQHTFMCLTKRVREMACAITDRQYPLASDWPLPNLWLGVTVCTPSELCKLDVLRQTPAARRFVSFEPLLGDMEYGDLTGIDWVIVGCETGPGARHMDHDWAIVLRDRCRTAEIPFFFKRGTPDRTKDATYLDGCEYHQFPEASTR